MKPIVTEKAVMMIESQNVLAFEVSTKMNKTEIKKEIEDVFNVKVDGIRTLIRNNKKYVYVKLNKKDLAIDVATKLGII
jgi:large subunit ribosomal protein L23